jgi:hypothetical protein
VLDLVWFVVGVVLGLWLCAFGQPMSDFQRARVALIMGLWSWVLSRVFFWGGGR